MGVDTLEPSTSALSRMTKGLLRSGMTLGKFSVAERRTWILPRIGLVSPPAAAEGVRDMRRASETLEASVLTRIAGDNDRYRLSDAVMNGELTVKVVPSSGRLSNRTSPLR